MNFTGASVIVTTHVCTLLNVSLIVAATRR